MDINLDRGHYFFTHSLGRLFPEFYKHREPNWDKIKYMKPDIILDKNQSISKLYLAETVPSDKFILNALHFLRDSVKWEYRDDHHDVAWYVEDGCHCDYEYDIDNPQPHRIMPQWMLNMRQSMCDALNIDDPPNSCNINWYYNGYAGIGAHADDEDLFQGLQEPIQIIGISIGAEREFEIWEPINGKTNINAEDNEYKLIKSLLLPNMSYLTMEGMFQKYFKHAVPRYDINDINISNDKQNDENQDKEIEELIQNVGPRFNLTWRWITKHTQQCPLSK